MRLLFALSLLTLHICNALLGMTHETNGANANFHHCHDIRDAHNLIVLPELPAAKSIFFELDANSRTPNHAFRMQLLNSFVQHSIELPYLAFDARYKLRFVSDQPANDTVCSSEFSVPRKKVDFNRLVADNLAFPSDWSDDEANPSRPGAQDSKWQHAPNAAFADALGNKKYGAYYVSPESLWAISQSAFMPCSTIRFSTKVLFSGLEKCGALAITSLANDTVRVASYEIEIGLETPSEPNYGSNRVRVHLYADKYENFARLVLVNGISLHESATVSLATIGNLTINAERNDEFDMFIWMHASYELKRSMIVVHSANNAGIELLSCGGILQKDGVTWMNFLRFTTNTTVGVLEERLTVDIRSSKHTHHSDVTSIVVDLFVTNPRAIEVATNGQLRPLLTNHVVLYNGHSIVESDAEVIDGTQICMINNVVMPEEMANVVAVQISEAWLCVVPSLLEDASRILHCETQRHTVALFRNGKPNPDFNVTVVFPGRLGPTSVELCFATSLEITDNDMLTLQAPVQRYESRIELVPRTKVNGEPSLFESLAVERELDGVNELLRVDSSQAKAYSQYHLRRAIRKVKDAHDFHVRAVSFNVEPLVDTRHNMSSFSSMVVIWLVFFMFFCVIGVYVIISAVDWRVVFRRQTFAEYHRG
jgi:hypothetical protein